MGRLSKKPRETETLGWLVPVHQSSEKGEKSPTDGDPKGTLTNHVFLEEKKKGRGHNGSINRKWSATQQAAEYSHGQWEKKKDGDQERTRSRAKKAWVERKPEEGNIRKTRSKALRQSNASQAVGKSGKRVGTQGKKRGGPGGKKKEGATKTHDGA